MAQIRTRYKQWLLIATDHQVTGKRGDDSFELRKQRNIKQAMEAGKRKVDRLQEEEKMTAWKQTINIKQYLNQEGESDIVTIAQGIANELKSNSAAFGLLPDRLVDETRKAVELTNDEDYHNLKFNQVLAQIYDIADYERIWLGLR